MNSLPSIRPAVVAAGLLLFSAAQAQTASVSRPDPLDAQVMVPPVAHRSSLAGYRPGGETQPVPWKQANDTVTRIGGWRVYGREAAASEAPASAPAPGAPVQAPARPAGQGHHGRQ